MASQPIWIEEHIHAYALGALDAAEAARFEAIVAAEPLVAARVESIRRTLDLVPYALPLEEPPAELRAAVLERIGARGGPRVAPRGVPRPTTTVRSSRGFGLKLALAASLVAVAGLLTWNLWSRDPSSSGLGSMLDLPAGRTFALAPTGDPDAHARVFVDARDGRGELVVAGLAPIAQERLYHLWFAKVGGAPKLAGTFRVDERGEARVPIHFSEGVDDLRAIAITEEAAPGVSSPTGPHLVDLVD